MNGMIDYIFGSLHTSQKALCAVRKTLRSQRKFNKAAVVALTALTVHAMTVNVALRYQEKEIKKLRTEIEELKGAEGVNE